jgi:hypothetical protein
VRGVQRPRPAYVDRSERSGAAAFSPNPEGLVRRDRVVAKRGHVPPPAGRRKAIVRSAAGRGSRLGECESAAQVARAFPVDGDAAWAYAVSLAFLERPARGCRPLAGRGRVPRRCPRGGVLAVQGCPGALTGRGRWCQRFASPRAFRQSRLREEGDMPASRSCRPRREQDEAPQQR